ncbi:dnaJ [Symbiodinium natans]|uniref:DnaJ protein n=1 Tax=Symbiodinium natans TaxID=878477 RepID=A0A812P4P9_9DINO|nr:dnaJ [Symbiodinium natans]
MDLIFRLKEATFGLRPGEFGPLPVDPKNAARPAGSGNYRPPPRPKARSAPTPPPPEATRETQDTGDENTSAMGPRVRRFMQEFPGFCGQLPGEDAESWTDQELKQYFYSNGYIRPKQRALHQPGREDPAMRRHLATLGLQPPTSAEAVKRAFRSLALKYHPDKRPDDQTTSADFQRIKDAYDALTAAGLA